MASKIGKKEWIGLYIVTGIIDFIQFVIIECVFVWFFGVGAAINEFLDPIVGVALAGYFQIRGVSLFKRVGRVVSMLGMEVAEEITGGVVQLWILEVWYMQKSAMNEEAEENAEPEGTTQPRTSRQPVNAQPGIRAPRLPTTR